MRPAAALALIGGMGIGLSSACGATTIVATPDNAAGSAGSGGADGTGGAPVSTGGSGSAATAGSTGASGAGIGAGGAGTGGAGTGGAGTGGDGAGGAGTGGSGTGGAGGAAGSGGSQVAGMMHTLTVTKTGSGKVTSTPIGDIDCGATCSKMYQYATTAPMISLTATPDAQITFGGWGGDCNGVGACMVTMSAEHTVSANFKDCRPASIGATQYVDHANGVDDAAHGGAIGTCAYKTLTYALAHSTGAVQLLGTDTFPGGVVDEAAPYTLGGTQKIFCNNAKFTWPTGSGSYGGLVGFSGTANTVDGCRLDGAMNGGYCALVSTTGAHTFSNNTVTNCGNVAVYVTASVSGITFIGNTFTSNNLGIDFAGTNGGVLTNNTMVSGGNDVYCATANAGVTGSGNVRGGGSITCAGCTHCPF